MRLSALIATLRPIITWRWIALNVLVAIYYACLSLLGQTFATLPPGNVSALYPPSGIALAAIFIGGYRLMPGIWFGSFFGNMPTLLNGMPLATGLTAVSGIAIVAALQAGLGTLLLRRFPRQERFFDSVEGVLSFALFGGLLSSVLTSSVGTLLLMLLGYIPYAAMTTVWFTWWLGDVAGVLVFAPPLIIWRYAPVLTRHLGRWIEPLILGAALIIVAFFALNTTYPLAFLLIPALLVFAYRYEAYGASLAIVIVSTLANWATAQGRSQFVTADMNESLLMLQAFIGTLAMTALLLAAALHERRRSTLALAEINRTLEDKVKARTFELTEARDAAETANRAKTLFVAQSSHELRTPLTAILGYAELLQSGYGGEVTPTQYERLGRIVTSARRLLDIINNTLDISAVEAGKVELQITRFNPALVLKEITTTLEGLAMQRGLKLTLNIHPNLPQEVANDAGRLQQVVVNLIGNALKFTDQGEVSIDAYPDGAQRWIIQVNDTGVGIPVEAQAAIFKAFERARTPHPSEGSGLGLAISQHFVHLMGGHIHVQSEIGNGSRFTVTLPRDVRAPDHAAVN